VDLRSIWDIHVNEPKPASNKVLTFSFAIIFVNALAASCAPWAELSYPLLVDNWGSG
jgi:hypothetical protein